MARLDPLSRRNIPEFEPVWQTVEQSMGFVPNSMLIMARDPELLLHFGLLSRTAFGSENAPVSWWNRLRLFWRLAVIHLGLGPKRPDASVPQELRMLVAMAASLSAGCQYCTAHSGHAAFEEGVAQEKIDDLLRYEESPHFTPAERAALALGFAAGRVPNETTEEHFDELKKHYTERQIIDLMGTVAIMGFLNRWNDTLGTPLEPGPKDWAQKSL